MLITLLFWVITLRVIYYMAADTVKELAQEYDCESHHVDFEKLICDLDEKGLSEFRVGLRLLRGKYDQKEFDSSLNEAEGQTNGSKTPLYLDDCGKAC